jgi:lipoprotein
MMKKTKLAALALCFALLVCALTGVACGTQTDSGKTEWSFGADLPVACEENEKVSIVLNVEGADDYEVVYEVVFGTTQVEVSEGGEFTPAAAGTYTVKVKVTAKGETKEKTYTLTVTKDATDPVITTKIADKTVEKGEYNFAGDLAEIVAADNKTQAENLVKSIVSVTIDGTALEMTENACTFERAGEYNVSYKVTDEEGNSANASYKITVKGLYLNEKAFVSKVFQLAEYEIAEAKVYGIENAAVKVTLAQGDEINEVAMGAKVKFLNVSDAVLKYVLLVGEEEKEIIEKTVKITALDLMISAADFSATEGDEITIPSASLSHETAGVTISVKISGQYQEEQAVAQGDTITAASGVTDITYTAENEDKSFSLTRVISVVAIGRDEIVSFEQVNGDNPDFNVPPLGMKLGNEELNSEPAYVHSGKYSAKLIFGPQRPNADTFGAGFCYWDNQIRNANVEGANGISMWIYCDKEEAYIVAAIATGATGKGYSGARISHVIKLGKGWNEVNINFDYQVYDAGEKTTADGTVLGALDIKNGISELCFYRVKKDAYTNWDSVNGGNYTDYIYDNALSVYVDEVRIRKFEIPDGVYFTFDKTPEATGTVGGTAVAPAPRMLVEEGVTLTVTVTDPNNKQTTVNAGDSFDLTLGGYYTLTYKAEKEGKPTQEVSFQVLATDPAEFLSFETINGATPDIAKGIYGNVTANTDSRYVKAGKQSAKLETVLNEWGNCSAGFAWDGGALQMPTVENANGITFWMYSETATYLYTYITTGVGDTWASLQSKPIALEAGWNYVTIDVRYDLASTNEKFNLANGLQELYFKTGDANDVGTTPATLYIDSVCFSVLPDRVIENLAIDYMNINLPEDQTVLGDREFGMVTRCTDEEYTKNGKPSLKLEMFADEEPLKTMRACYSSWGKGILLTAGENAVKFDVYASRAAFVSFEFGTGGNAGSGAYSGAKFAKVIELKQGWNTVTLTFGDKADVQGATLADGIVHFGATTVNSISALPDNGCFPDVASEELTLYVATMYAIVA